MILCGSRGVQHILHILLIGVIFGLQVRQQLEVDHSLSNLPDISSAVAMASLVIVLLLHMVRAFSAFGANSRKESDSMKVSRNFLGGVALVMEFIALGLRRGTLEDDNLTVASIIVGGLCLVRLMDTLQDFDDPWEAVSVQCIDGMPDQPNSGVLRLILIHLFIALAIAFDAVSLARAEEGNTPGNMHNATDHDWALKNGTTGEWHYDANREDNDVRTLSIVTLSFMILHFILYPGNRFVLRATGMDKMFLAFSGCNCLCARKKSQNLDNCPEDGNPMNRQANERIGKEKVLVSLSRLPLLRQIVSTFIICGLSFVAGATYGLHESQYRAAALISYAAYDIIGRNKL